MQSAAEGFSFFQSLLLLTQLQLISVSCGAHGLNLTAANRAIVFDH